jgi:succinate dehydrogenase flavin-adding protein (antitoxin of CptAB toxin-antitoxin module)
MSAAAPVQAFVAPDGKIFTGEGAREACANYIRLPLVKAAIMPLANSNEEFTQWLIDNEEEITNAFEVDTIRRVTKKEKAALSDALNKITEMNNPDLTFITDNATAILESFRWPTVRRLKDEEKLIAARNNLNILTKEDQELVEWLLKHKEALMEAYEAGKIKRQMSDKARVALEEYRAKKAAEKAAAEAA